MPMVEWKIVQLPNKRWAVHWRDEKGDFHEDGNCETGEEAQEFLVDLHARLRQIAMGTLPGLAPGRPKESAEPRHAFPLMLTDAEKTRYRERAKAKNMSLSAYIRSVLNKEVE